MEIIQILDGKEKSKICHEILKNLPQWFGDQKIITEYCENVAEYPFFTAVENDETVGFIALKEHNIYTSEIYVMGILNLFQHKGIGTELLKSAEKHCQDIGNEFLTVKTLDGSINYEPYANTRKFYRAMGFIPLEVFKEHWDKENPCLFSVKSLRSNDEVEIVGD